MKYAVEIPIVGSMVVEIKAGSEDEAIEVAKTKFCEYVYAYELENNDEIIEYTLSAVGQIVNGNVVNCPINEITVIDDLS